MKKDPSDLSKPKVPTGGDRSIVYGRRNTGFEGRAGGGTRPSIQIVPPKGSGVPKKTPPQDDEGDTLEDS